MYDIKEAIKLDFPTKAEDFDIRAEKLFKLYNEKLDAIIKVPKEKRTFSNSFEAYEDADAHFSVENSSLTFPANMSIDKAIRDASNEVEAKISKFIIKTSMREDLYQAFVDAIAQNNGFTDLDAVSQRLVKKTMEGFEKNGLQLDKTKREQLEKLKSKISDNGVDFSKNIAEDKTKISFTKEELAGVPQNILEGFEKDADKPGNYFVSLKYPELLPTMRNCEVAETRKRLEYANATKCQAINTPILEETFALRKEAANLLGFPDHSSYITKYLMSKSKENVVAFQKKMIDLLLPHGKKDLERLVELKKAHYAEKGWTDFEPVIKSYDYPFYNNLLLQRDYQVDQNEVQQYFPLQVVVDGIFGVYQELLNLKIIEIPAYNPWHQDVKMYAIRDSHDDHLMGHFYLDLYPREGKYSHAAVWPLVPRSDVNQHQLPVAGMLCNFTKPTADTPSLLTHDEVVTFCHEMGHVMHNMSTTVKFPSFSGTSVERDAVEFPSQCFECWCWREEILDRISAHHKDHTKKLPSDLAKRLIAAKNLNSATFYLRQLVFSTFDMAVHGDNPEFYTNTGEHWRKISRDVGLLEVQQGVNPAASFGHIMGGYDSQYYSYMWSEVFSADVFSVFEEKGVMNSQLGQKLRDTYLAVGGSQDSTVGIKNFLGRDVKEDNFLKSIGLA